MVPYDEVDWNTARNTCAKVGKSSIMFASCKAYAP